MIDQRNVTTKRQAVRRFRELLASCNMGASEYIDVLRTLAEMANDFADNEMILQRIATIEGQQSRAPTIWRFPDLS